MTKKIAKEDRNLPIGTRLVGRYKKVEYHATVVEGEKGGLRYRLESGTGDPRSSVISGEFKSPSAAASAITGHPMNGWAWWSLDKAPTRARKPKAEEGTCPTEDEMAEEKRIATEAGHPVADE